MKKETSKIKLLKGKNLRGFSIFLVVSFLFLVLSKLSETYTEQLQFKVELSGLDDDVTVVSDSLYIVNATVKSRGFSLLPYVFYNPRPIVLNANNELTKKANTYSWDVYNNTHKISEVLKGTFDVISVNPDTLIFNYQRLSSKTVPIVFNSDISYALGYDVENTIVLRPDSAKVIGPEDKIKSITSVTNELMTLENVNSDFSKTVRLNYEDKPADVNIIPNTIEVEAVVKRFTEGTLEVPITMKNVPRNVTINFFPKALQLSYYVSLEDYKAIKATDFLIECNYEEASDTGLKYLIPRVVKKPKNVKNVKLNQTKIDFIIL